MNAFKDGLMIVQADDVAPQPWKNGGGVTRELLRLPLPGAGPDDWLLRISVADIEADGPFSPFPGVQRWFAVLSGRGVRLDWPAGTRSAGKTTELTPRSQPMEFDGADAPHCRLIDGPTRDLNVMARTAFGSAYLRNATIGSGSFRASQGIGVFTREPLLLLRGSDRIRLPARALAWHDGHDTAAWSLAPLPDAAASPAQTSGGPVACWIGLSLATRPGADAASS